MDNLVVIILAAGKGIRMKTYMSKVCHYVVDKTMIEHIVLTAESLTPYEIVIVVTKDNIEHIRKILRNYDVRLKIQSKPLGTCHAVLSSMPCCGSKKDLLILLGDVPLIKPKTIKKMSTTSFDAVIMGFIDKDINNQSSRIIIKKNRVHKIIDFFDLNSRQRKITLCDSGMLWLKYKYIKLLHIITNDNSKNEYHLTDIVEIMVNRGLRVGFLEAGKKECMDVNTKDDLNEIN